MHRKLLILLLISSIIGFVLGLFNVFNGNFSGIAWPFIPLEIFIWGDAFILSPFFIIISMYLLKKNNINLTGIILSTYYSIRSFVEVINDLYAQHSTTVRPWETKWENYQIVQSLGKMEVFVISQLFFTIITVISLTFLIKFLKYYFKQKS